MFAIQKEQQNHFMLRISLVYVFLQTLSIWQGNRESCSGSINLFFTTVFAGLLASFVVLVCTPFLRAGLRHFRLGFCRNFHAVYVSCKKWAVHSSFFFYELE